MLDVRTAWGATASERAFRLAVLSSLLLGLWLRVWGYLIDPPSLWLDEAYWAVKAITRSAAEAQIRPIGFMQVTSWLIQVFGPRAALYRLMPFIASLVSLFAMTYVASQLFRSRWTILVAVLLFAIHPVALEMSAEFKHYGVEIGIYTLLIAAYLYYRSVRRLWTFAALLFLAWFSFLFSLTVIFAYPALFVLLAWEAFAEKKWWRLATVGTVAALCIATILTVYFITWKGIAVESAEKKWAKNYDVFHVEEKRKDDTKRLEWTLIKYFDAVGFPGIGRLRWESKLLADKALVKLRTADRVFWCALHVAGVLYLILRRRYATLLWLWLPFLWVMFFNFIGRWPAGAFRTNSFLIPYSLLLAAFSVEWLSETRRIARFGAPVLAIVMLLPALYFRPLWHKKGLWAAPGAFPEVLAILHSGKMGSLEAVRDGDKQVVLLDNGSCKQWKYYVNYDREVTTTIGPELLRRLTPLCKRQERQLGSTLRRLARTEGDRGFWVVVSEGRKFDLLEQKAIGSCAKLETRFVKDRANLVIRCVGRKKS